MRFAWTAALKTAGILVAIALVLIVGGGSGLVPCAFARATHHPCPGCGSTRSVVALLHGDLAGVLRFNPFGPVMALVLGLLGVETVVTVLRRGDTRAIGSTRAGRFLTRALVAVAALEIALWVARFFGVFGGPVPV
jgi:hypothetical protein